MSRTGVIARKIGMTRIFTDGGVALAATVLQIKGNIVIGAKTKKQNGYNAVQVAFGDIRANSVSKPLRGVFAQAKVEPRRKIAEFRVAEDALLKIGHEINADHYVIGQSVDIAGTSIGKGFAGAMKRHNFAGLEATHGVSISHRSHGSTGQCQDPGKVFKGKKMAGHMGDVQVTVQNLEIIATDLERGLIIVYGAVPGSKGGYVHIRDSVKKILPAGVPYPAASKGDNKENAKEAV
jgi:large subunit ribosomal protein L3